MQLCYIGRDIARRDPAKFLDGLRAKYPAVSETGIQEIARTELGKTPPRYPQEVVHLFGADVLSEDVTTMAAWPWISAYFRRVLQQSDDDAKQRLIDPADLSRTYVWRRTNGWTQEVSDADVAVIRQSSARTWFRDTERFGAFVPTRMWDLPVIESHTFDNQFDADAYRKDQQRKARWRGV